MRRDRRASRDRSRPVLSGDGVCEGLQIDCARPGRSNRRALGRALHLRAMNMLYEGLKEKGALMLIPSSAVETMGMGGMLGAAAMRQEKLAAGAPGNTDSGAS